MRIKIYRSLSPYYPDFDEIGSLWIIWER